MYYQMYYIHIIKDHNVIAVKTLQYVPAIGDEIRLEDEKIYKVFQRVWCLDEDNISMSRVNIGVKEIT